MAVVQECGSAGRCLYCSFAHIASLYPDHLAVVQAASRLPPPPINEPEARASSSFSATGKWKEVSVFPSSYQTGDQSRSEQEEAVNDAFDASGRTTERFCHNESVQEESISASQDVKQVGHASTSLTAYQTGDQSRSEEEEAVNYAFEESGRTMEKFEHNGRVQEESVSASQDIKQVGHASDTSVTAEDGVPAKPISFQVKLCHGDVAFSYSKLCCLIDTLAQYICQHGNLPNSSNSKDVGVGSSSVTVHEFWLEQTSEKRVGILMSPSVEYIVATLAVLKCGALFVPLDPFWPIERVLAVLADAKPCFLLTHGQENSAFVDALSSAKVPILCLGSDFVRNCCKLEHHSSCWCFCHGQRKRHGCYIMYTSGSTGKPKGVIGTEEGLLNRLLWMQNEFPFLRCDLTMFKTSVSFIDHLTEFLGPLISGSSLLVPPATDLFRNPLALIPFLQTYNISRLTAVPSLMRALLPVLQTSEGRTALKSLVVLVLSGEVLPIWLVEVLHGLAPQATILNLYGSTELSGDCLFFNCGALWREQNQYLKGLNSVPIGKPLPDSDVWISRTSSDWTEEGELWVGGVLLALGYSNDSQSSNEKFVNLTSSLDACNGQINQRMFQTGDYVKRLEDGNLVYLGRKDRTVKIHGHRVALQEVESNIEMHPYVARVAVIAQPTVDGDQRIIAFVVPKLQHETGSLSSSLQTSVSSSDVSVKAWHSPAIEVSLRNWLTERLPAAMIPTIFNFLPALPTVDSLKVDYQVLSRIETDRYHESHKTDQEMTPLKRYIKKVFQQTLSVENVCIDDDFFSLGGTSVSAAHVAHILGIDMRCLYKHSSVVALGAVLESQQAHTEHVSTAVLKTQQADTKHTATAKRVEDTLITRNTKYMRVDGIFSAHAPVLTIMKGESNTNLFSELLIKGKVLQKSDDGSGHHTLTYVWPYIEVRGPRAWLRCNKSVSLDQLPENSELCAPYAIPIGSSDSCILLVVWKTFLKACVDASPLLVRLKDLWHLFIGSHAHNFVCMDALNGSLIWETGLGARIESTAAITSDFKQVVVGCYDGYLYFLDIVTGAQMWKFSTGAEVKCQPILDTVGHVWCGSHDHYLYLISPPEQRCILKYDCKGSIFSAPAYDSSRGLIYAATTSGLIVAIKSDASDSKVLWTYSSSVPIFGSLNLDHSTGYVICSLVNGSVLALTPDGTLVWKYCTLGPVFAGATLSRALPSQVLICSRDGWIYSLNLMDGACIWKHCLGEPITSAACVDEAIELVCGEVKDSVVYNHNFRLVCACGSSGQLHLLKIYSGLALPDSHDLNNVAEGGINDKELEREIYMKQDKATVDNEEQKGLKAGAGYVNIKSEEMKNCEPIAAFKLPGDVFSSPVMLGGRIFVGCRDNNFYCIELGGLGTQK